MDQFEELFTQCEDRVRRNAFLEVMTELASPMSGVDSAVIVSLRIDFYANLAATWPLAESMVDTQVLVGPLDKTQLVAAVLEPAKRAGFSVEDDLVDVLVRDFIPAGSIKACHDAGALPLLSHALLETWHLASRGKMTVADYHAAGGMSGAVEASAERAFAELAPAAQLAVKHVFLRLVHVERNSVATRRAAYYRELHGLAATGVDDSGDDRDKEVEARSVIMELLSPFVTARLLTADEFTVQISHEAVLEAWPRLRMWLDEDCEALRLQRTITEATQVWLENDRDPSTLLSGVRLTTIQSWSASGFRTVVLSRDERDFIAASNDRAVHEEQRRRRQSSRLRVLAAAATCFALLASALAAVANHARSNALAARDEALSRQTAVNAERLRGSDPGLAGQLSVVAYRISSTSEARSALLQSSVVPRSSRYLGGPGPTALAAAPDDGLVAVSNAVDGSVQLFTQSERGLIRGGAIVRADADVDVYAVALTPDERTLAVGDAAGGVSLWDVSDVRHPRRIGGASQGSSGAIHRLSITPDGTELAAARKGDGV
ncbi:MAG: WD40 repeat domain-containing protein, partial [Actinobacteria bacterium]|nr:WD40 repeat domain-containing protein [Actinomycetota bacterium]